MKDICILGIDPGVTTCGISVIKINENGEYDPIYSNTIHTEKFLHTVQHIEYSHGKRFAKVQILSNIFKELLIHYNPDAISVESSYMNTKFPDAYGALIEVVNTLRLVVFQFDPAIPVELISPSSVKQAVGVNGKSGDKSLVKQALLTNHMLVNKHILPHLDEHSIDSLAVAITLANRIQMCYT